MLKLNTTVTVNCNLGTMEILVHTLFTLGAPSLVQCTVAFFYLGLTVGVGVGVTIFISS